MTRQQFYALFPGKRAENWFSARAEGGGRFLPEAAVLYYLKSKNELGLNPILKGQKTKHLPGVFLPSS